jgi:hypothetical protein
MELVELAFRGRIGIVITLDIPTISSVYLLKHRKHPTTEYVQ